MRYILTRTDNNTGCTTKSPEIVFDYVLRVTRDEQEAIEASSWAEVADSGTEYTGEIFTIRAE